MKVKPTSITHRDKLSSAGYKFHGSMLLQEMQGDQTFNTKKTVFERQPFFSSLIKPPSSTAATTDAYRGPLTHRYTNISRSSTSAMQHKNKQVQSEKSLLAINISGSGKKIASRTISFLEKKAKST